MTDTQPLTLIRVTDAAPEDRVPSPDPEMCRAVLHMGGNINGKFPCVLENGHGGMHQDDEGDCWMIRSGD